MDWRALIISLLNIPSPTRECLLALQATYAATSTGPSGKLSVTDFLAIPLWFEQDQFAPVAGEFNRPAAMKQLLFTVIVEEIGETEISYNDLLLYFCEHPASLEGLERAALLLLPSAERQDHDLSLSPALLFELLHHGRFFPAGVEPTPTLEDLNRVL